MSRRAPRCSRRSCARPRERWQHLCASCWARVPAQLRARIEKERKAKHHVAMHQLYAQAIDILDGRQPAAAVRRAPAQAAPL